MKIRHVLAFTALGSICFLAGRASGQAPAAKGLQKFVGTFEVSGKFWFQPGQPPQHTKATATFKPVLGGKYVRQDYTDPNFRVKGVGFMGYDPRTQQWSSVWMYNMSQQMEYSSGKADQNGVLQLTGGKRAKATRRYSHEWTDPDTRVMKSWWELPGGERSMVYEMTYRRKK